MITKKVQKSEFKMISFRDVAPKEEGHDLSGIPDFVITKLVDLVKEAQANVKGHDQKSIMSGLDLHLGSGIECRTVLKLVARLDLLSRELKDGKNKGKLKDYLKRLIAHAAFHCGWRGRDLLEIVAGDVQVDLRDCKSEVLVPRSTKQR